MYEVKRRRRNTAAHNISKRQRKAAFELQQLLNEPVSPRRICAVTRGFQTTTPDLSVFPFLPKHYHMTRVLVITTIWTPDN